MHDCDSSEVPYYKFSVCHYDRFYLATANMYLLLQFTLTGVYHRNRRGSSPEIGLIELHENALHNIHE